MSKQVKTMPKVDLKMYVRIVAVVFLISSGTAFTMVMLRLLHPELFYEDFRLLKGSDLGIHYFICGLMALSAIIGFLNSCVVLHRPSSRTSGRGLTVWLLLDSVFETARVVYVFVCEVVLQGAGGLHSYELLVSGGQYLLDSFLYCQMILRH